MFSKKYQFVTVGGSTRDFMFYDPDAKFLFTPENVARQKSLCFEYGSKINVDKTYFTFGGGAANSAVNLANLGFKTGIITSVGGDENGQAILNNFKKRGVDIRLAEVRPRQMTGFSFVLTAGKEKEHVIFLYRGANNQLQAPLKRIKAKWFYIASLSGSNWRSILDRVFSQKKSLIAWNPGERQLSAGFKGLKDYLAKTEVLALNKDEAVHLVISIRKNQSDANLKNVRYLLKELKKAGPRLVLITSGKNGADVFDGQKYYHQPILKTRKVLDTTGVGDCFDSTFVAGLEKYHGNIKKALTAGMKNTAGVVTEVGAQNGLAKVM